MRLTRPELEARLAAIEGSVPKLLEDPSNFPRAFEDRVEILLGQLDDRDQVYALVRLEQIAERSGFNRTTCAGNVSV